MAESAFTACRRCREQKLRCSRQQPECARCARLGTVCTYPDPPDRKALASMRASARKRRQTTTITTATTATTMIAPDAVKPQPISDNQRQQLVGPSQVTHDTNVPHVEHSFPSGELQELLQNLYFTCTFNSSLLFHRPTFTRLWIEEELPEHVLLSVCAMGSIFVTPASLTSIQNTDLFPSISNIKSSAKRWALDAGSMVSQTIDQPTLAGLQTCAVLALYWFAVGERPRNAMFSGIAYRGLREVRTDLTTSASGHGVTTAVPERSYPLAWLENEIVNRSFWATWISNCINSDHYITGTSADSILTQIPLPADESSFIQLAPTARVMLSNVDALNQNMARISNPSEVSVMAELVKMVRFWIKVRDHIESQKRNPTQDTVKELLALDGKILGWASGLPSTFAYSKRNLYEQLVVKQQPTYSVVHASFHQCRLVLHSSLVPQFSGVSLQVTVPLDIIRMSARAAWESAKAVSGLAADLVALDWDMAQLAPFFGYCMYVSASIHISFIFSKKIELAAAARSRLLSSLQILKSMKSFWTNLDTLWERIQVLYEVNATRNNASSNPPDHAMSHDSQPALNDVDALACINRDTGTLTEPLAESVLQYSLQKLQRLPMLRSDMEEGSQSLRDLEDLFHTDRIAELLDGAATATPTHTVSSATMNQPSGSIGSTTSRSQTSGQAASAEMDRHKMSSGQDAMPHHQLAAMGPDFGGEWFDINMDLFPVEFSSIDDFFHEALSWIEQVGKLE